MGTDKIPTSIVDKNGKQTTVHKNAYVAPKTRTANIVPQLSAPIPDLNENDEHITNLLNKAVVDIDHEWTQKYRVPVVPDLHTGLSFVAALVTPGESSFQKEFLAASDDEAALIGSYIQFKLSAFREGFKASIRKHPIDLDQGVNTTIFAKTEDGWIYRKATWTMQPFSPISKEDGQFFDLSQLIDRIERSGLKPSEKWNNWKLENGLSEPNA